MSLRARFHGWIAAPFVALVLAIPSTSRASPLPGFVLVEAKPRRLRVAIPGERNAWVEKWVRYFSVDDRERFQKFLDRGALYKTLVQDILAQHGVPVEMYYLAMIESGFNIEARSWASAVGMWQFIRPTARLYGLRTSRDIDERLDVMRATHAAARYLKRLHREFGSWYLAMAAYNCGEGRVRRAIRRGRTRDYWKLAFRGHLPAETANYVPKFHAAMLIGRNPRRFGFTPPRFLEFPKVKKMRVKGDLPLSVVAKRHGIPLEALKALNPHLIEDATPRRSRGYSLWIPARAKDLAGT